MSNYTRLALYTDGASRGNPGPAASGVHIVDDTTRETVAGLGFALGTATNNVAEYQAVLHALAWLLANRELLADDIHINFRMDSKLVVSQLSGQWKIKGIHSCPPIPSGCQANKRPRDRSRFRNEMQCASVLPRGGHVARLCRMIREAGTDRGAVVSVVRVMRL